MSYKNVEDLSYDELMQMDDKKLEVIKVKALCDIVYFLKYINEKMK